MLEWNRRQRDVLVDKLPDVANVAAAALIFGQSLGDKPFSASLASSGLAIWIALMAYSLVLAAERGRP